MLMRLSAIFDRVGQLVQQNHPTGAQYHPTFCRLFQKWPMDFVCQKLLGLTNHRQEKKRLSWKQPSLPTGRCSSLGLREAPRRRFPAGRGCDIRAAVSRHSTEREHERKSTRVRKRSRADSVSLTSSRHNVPSGLQQQVMSGTHGFMCCPSVSQYISSPDVVQESRESMLLAWEVCLLGLQEAGGGGLSELNQP